MYITAAYQNQSLFKEHFDDRNGHRRLDGRQFKHDEIVAGRCAFAEMHHPAFGEANLAGVV